MQKDNNISFAQFTYQYVTPCVLPFYTHLFPLNSLKVNYLQHRSLSLNTSACYFLSAGIFSPVATVRC